MIKDELAHLLKPWGSSTPIVLDGSALCGTLPNARVGLDRLARVPAYGPALILREIVYADSRQVYREIVRRNQANLLQIVHLLLEHIGNSPFSLNTFGPSPRGSQRGNLESYHSTTESSNLIFIPTLFRKSVPKIISYLHGVPNTKTL